MLVWHCAFNISFTNMIEAPFRRPDPSREPAGREPQSWDHESTPLNGSADSEDDVFQDRLCDKSRETLVGQDIPKKAHQGYNEEFESARNDDEARFKDPKWLSSGDMTQAGQGELALHKHGELPSGRGSLVDEDVPSKTIRVSSPLALKSAITNATSSDPGDGELGNQVDSALQSEQKEKGLKLSPEGLHELTSPAQSLPLRALAPTDPRVKSSGLPPSAFRLPSDSKTEECVSSRNERDYDEAGAAITENGGAATNRNISNMADDSELAKDKLLPTSMAPHSARMSSGPSSVKALQSSKLRLRTAQRMSSKHTPTPLRFEDGRPAGLQSSMMGDSIPSPMPETIPLPPMSLPTYLQLELSSLRPSPLYIHRSVTSDFPYESSRAKVERLLNFLLLPPQLEQVLWFGTFACLDAWLYTFTILPLRLIKSLYILGQSWVTNLAAEVQYVSSFVFTGTGRMWRRRRTRGSSASRDSLPRRDSTPNRQPEKLDSSGANGSARGTSEKQRPGVAKRIPTDETTRKARRHRRKKSVPSALLPDDKADILKGLLIISTCLILMRFDASRMYHWIKGQAAIKLYVFYNVLEVGDRLLSAIGQDVLECLFSREALERGPDGHSKVHRPFWLFLLALGYTVVHATALFYQVITLNVAVNSYSNALITLLMSNQFVEIKSTVFKKFEKENLFQLTCADVVERFQLSLMLLIIASRNIVETGGLSAGLSAFGSFSSSSSSPTATNSSNLLNQPPRSAASILPRSFTLLPNILSSLTSYAPGVGHVLGPFLVVLGSEMLVDWLKHSYINKFNNTRPAIYGRFLDVLTKDYYSNAFADQNLTKRLGLPVIPLSCLFIRASVQTYHMFLASWVPLSLPSTSTGLTSAHNQHTSSATSVPTSTAAALSQIFDDLLRHIPPSISSSRAFSNFSTILIFLLGFLVLLTLKLVLGMLLLAFARSRYRSMKEREKNSIHHVEGGRRVGGWGVVEVDDDKRRWIYEDDAEGARGLREREERDQVMREKGTAEGAFEKVKRYEMVAKRIW